MGRVKSSLRSQGSPWRPGYDKEMSRKHRNILILVADDLGLYTQCHGCKTTRTPNLDRLAAEGVKFDFAFASTASCSGSRSVIYTGLHTHENGQYGLLG